MSIFSIIVLGVVVLFFAWQVYLLIRDIKTGRFKESFEKAKQRKAEKFAQKKNNKK